jgi:hypothetical protein
MEVHFAPDVQAMIDEFVVETGYAPDKLIEDAAVGYLAQREQTREMLDSRYDDLERVKPIDGEEAFARLKAKTEAHRKQPA